MEGVSTTTDSENKKSSDNAKVTNLFGIFKREKDLTTIETNMSSSHESAVKEVIDQRFEKGILYPGNGLVLTVEKSDDSVPKCGCYIYLVDSKGKCTTDGNSDQQNIICFVHSHEDLLNLFRSDLDKYCSEILQHLTGADTGVIDAVSGTSLSLLKDWYSNSIGYLVRCVQVLQDNLRYLIYSALLDYKLVTSGGTSELQSDIQRFYRACSLQDILSQLKENPSVKSGSESGSSIDMLVDVDQAVQDTQGSVTVSITADSVKLDATGCNKFCEDWSNALNRQEYQDNATKLKQIIEAFKLKFIQTVNTLKRLLREAENDYYALYRSYVFLRDSGQSDMLLHYVTVEANYEVKDVLQVLQDFIKEQHS